jgi:hypothetical protein
MGGSKRTPTSSASLSTLLDSAGTGEQAMLPDFVPPVRSRKAERMASGGYRLGPGGRVILSRSSHLGVSWPSSTGSASVTVASTPHPRLGGHMTAIRKAVGERPSSASVLMPGSRPSHQPPSRHDLVLLCAWIQEQLSGLEDSHDTAEAFDVWDRAMDALIQQVAALSADRGRSATVSPLTCGNDAIRGHRLLSALASRALAS